MLSPAVETPELSKLARQLLNCDVYQTTPDRWGIGKPGSSAGWMFVELGFSSHHQAEARLAELRAMVKENNAA